MKLLLLLLAVSFSPESSADPAVQVAVGEVVDYRLALSADPKCTKAGPMCKSCSDVVICMHDGTGWTEIPVGSCNSTAVCVDGECTEAADPFCDGTADLDFPCWTVGVFPDPFYCDKYHICVKGEGGLLEAHGYECSQGYGFDIASDLCNVKLMKGQCTEGIFPIPLCTKMGDMGPLRKKDSLYYICKLRDVTQGNQTRQVLYPYIYKCADGNHYTSADCVPL